jgi:t-SNARE complex subunit (syntaxin)
MASIRDLGFEFNVKVEEQGERLEEVGKDLGEANVNTNRATQELNQYAQSLKGQGIKMAVCLVILLLVLAFLIWLIVK